MKLFKLAKIFYGKVINKFWTWLSLKTGYNYTKPDGIYYFVSNRCNFRCPMCPQWEMGFAEKQHDCLTVEQVKQAISEASAWGVTSFGISGGETLLFRDKVLELLAYANSQKMYTHFVTNGFLLTESIIRQYDASGGGHISLSVDADSELHDKLRGMPGAYQHVLQAIKAFQKVKPKNILLKINLVISDWNLSEVIRVVNLTKNIGASIFVQPFDPYNWHNRKSLTHEQYHQQYPLWIAPANMGKLEKVVQEMIKIKKQQPSLIINAIEHLQDIVPYFGLQLVKNQCYVGYRTLVINPDGTVSVCKFGTVGNIKKQSLHQIWQSSAYQRVRQSSINCNFNCLLGCMYDPTIWSWVKSGWDLLKRRF